MAANAKSVKQADMDVNLDSLSREEKEALLTKKMDMIRQRNKALSERHKLIEVDRKQAEEAGQAVKPSVDSQILPAEGAPRPRGRGRGYPHPRDGKRPVKERLNLSGDFRETSHHEPVSDEGGNYQVKGRGWSRDKDAGSNATKDRRKPAPEAESSAYPSSFEYEPIVDMKDLDERFGPLFSSAEVRSQPQIHHKSSSGQPYTNRHQQDSDGVPERAYKGRLKDSEGPPPDPSFNPLADRRRTNTNMKEASSDYRRRPRNYTGSGDQSGAKQNMRNVTEKEQEKLAERKPQQIITSRRENQKHEQWKAERDRYDQARIQRQMNDGGSWRRAWDADKVSQEYDEQSPSYHPSQVEPGKHPGGLQQPSTPKQQNVTESYTPQGRGRGRGRGRGFVGGLADKSTNQSTMPGSNDRLVECQKELLLVKIDNTEGDSNVQVEYDDKRTSVMPEPSERASLPPKNPTVTTSSSTLKQQSHGSRQYQQNWKPAQQRAGAQKFTPDTSKMDSHGPSAVPKAIQHERAPGHGRDEVVATSSHSQSFEDSDEWEDCTDSSDVAEEDEFMPVDAGASGAKEGNSSSHLHLQCNLTPQIPENVISSPDFMKTPPGHVKVLDWAADACPSSPVSPDGVTTSQPSSS